MTQGARCTGVGRLREKSNKMYEQAVMLNMARGSIQKLWWEIRKSGQLKVVEWQVDNEGITISDVFHKILSHPTEVGRPRSSRYLEIQGLSYTRKVTVMKVNLFFVLGMNLLPQTMSSRTLVGCWLLSIIILTAIYGGNLVAFLTIPRLSAQIKSLEDLRKAEGSVTWGIPSGSTIFLTFQVRVHIMLGGLQMEAF